MQFSISSIKKNGKPGHIGRNSMILYLTTFFRFYTSDESTYDFVGKKVPSFGEAQSGVVAEFVNAVFDNEKFNKGSIERVLQRLSDVRLAHWKYSQ